MEEIPQNLEPKPREPINEADFLARINTITEEDIQALRDNVVPYQIDGFNKRDDLLILALLFKTSDTEIKDLIRIARQKNILTGIHELGSKLVTLARITNNGRYTKLWEEVKNEMSK